MAVQPRLFARNRNESNIIFKQISSEDFIITPLCIFSNDISLRQEFHSLSNCHFFGTENTNQCIDLIKQYSTKNSRILLVTSNQFIDFVHHHLRETVSLSHIYFFDNVLYNEHQLLSDRRFRGTFDNIQLLLDKIVLDIKEILRRPSHATGVIQYILDDNAKFFWYRFFFNVLDRLQHTNIAQRELISRIRGIPEENSHRCCDIDEFEGNYHSDKVIWWYTRESFFYRLLNGALRSNDINEIFSYRSYIQDLDRNLQKLCLKQVDSKRIYLFRGRKLHIDDINQQKNNIGKLITTTCFLSTTINRSFAEQFAGDSVPADSLFQPVLYIISIDSTSIKVTGADIRHLSMFPDEEEYLLSLRSIFRIERVEFVDNRWHIDLTAVDEDDQDFCTAINPWKATIGEQSFFSSRREPLFTRYLNIENGPFLAFQLLIDIMLRLDRTEFAREEMIEMCRTKYTNSPNDLTTVYEFERTYREEDAIKWYTTDSFLYRLLHQSLRMEDIDTIFKLRYYIRDLHKQLVQLHCDNHVPSSPINQSVLTLYRGQRMKINELEKLRGNVCKLISMNSFLSTTNDVAAAVFFAGVDSLDNPETEVAVLYQITIDTSVSHSIPFAKIKYLSIFEDEDEVLFSMASVFRIDKVEQYGNLWVVDLTLINKEDEEWNILTAHLDKSYTSDATSIQRAHFSLS